MRYKINYALGLIVLIIINCKSLENKVQVDPVKNLSKKFYFINYLNFEHLMMTSNNNEITIIGKPSFPENYYELYVDSVIKDKNIIIVNGMSYNSNISFFIDTIHYKTDLTEYYFRNMIFKHYTENTKIPPTNIELNSYFIDNKKNINVEKKIKFNCKVFELGRDAKLREKREKDSIEKAFIRSINQK